MKLLPILLLPILLIGCNQLQDVAKKIHEVEARVTVIEETNKRVTVELDGIEENADKLPVSDEKNNIKGHVAVAKSLTAAQTVNIKKTKVAANEGAEIAEADPIQYQVERASNTLGGMFRNFFTGLIPGLGPVASFFALLGGTTAGGISLFGAGKWGLKKVGVSDGTIGIIGKVIGFFKKKK